MPSGGVAMTFEQRVMAFWAKVNKNGPIPPDHPEMSNCWMWEGCKNHRNYGTFHIGFNEFGKQRNMKAHRVAFFLAHGHWPKEIDHLCHVTLCVRPDHMRDVSTHKENCANRRGEGLCRRGHRMEEPNLYYYQHYGKTVRRCLACMKAHKEKRA